MKKYYPFRRFLHLAYLLLLISFASRATSYEILPTANPDILGLKSTKFRGSIFKDTYPSRKLHTVNGFTPSLADIQDAEAVLADEIKKVNTNRINQFKGSPRIDKKLNSYFRQYVGYKDVQGNKFIHLNCHWDRFSVRERIEGIFDTRLRYDSDYTIVNDGGSYHWQCTIDLTKKKIIYFAVNGLG